jgi:hypothetical protein
LTRGGLGYGAFLLHVPQAWIFFGALVLLQSAFAAIFHLPHRGEVDGANKASGIGWGQIKFRPTLAGPLSHRNIFAAPP